MPYSEANKKKSRTYIKEVRKTTVCIICGNQPIDFHREAHELDGNLRPSRMAARGEPIEKIAAEIALCDALCRSCHMGIDGRSERLQVFKPRQKGVEYVGKKPCIECDTPYKPLRKGLCNRCNHKKRAGKPSTRGNW